jgi:TolB-like protein/Tfp pilus assembly protein PilF
VSQGDIVIDDDEMHGDGVYVAARLQEIAKPGGMCISNRVLEDIRDRLDINFEDGGEQALKNIARPVHVWRWSPGSTSLGRMAEPAPALPDKPSIAVLPFQNMSGDPEQEYFADGMVEDIITALSRTKALFVIARNSSFAYKGKSPDVRQVGRELGVRYVLEGSVRKAGNRVRITGQLIDAETGAHIWADRFDGPLEDIFDLQDQITARVVGVIAPAVEEAEITRAKRKLGSLQAYDYYLRGLSTMYRFTRESVEEARVLFQKAINHDPELAIAYATQAFCCVTRKSMAWDADRGANIAEAERVSREAVRLDRNDARVLALSGHALRFVVGRFEEGAALLNQAVIVDPNIAIGWAWRGTTKNSIGQPEEAISDLERAMRLSPRDAFMFLAHGQMAVSHLLCGRYDESVIWAESSLRLLSNHVTALRVLVASLAMAGRIEAAREAYATYQRLDPDGRISNLKDRIAFRRDEDVAKFANGLRLAGMPE